MLSVAKKLGSPKEMLATLDRAKAETQFSKSITLIKDAVPQALLVHGHNPLTLLHSALSEGVHMNSDEECLQIAHDVRILLGELSERLAQALKDERELNEAMTRLMSNRE